jgi:cobalt-zinc-cadmium efflux system protein
MGAGHSHDHGTAAGRHRGRLLTVLVITLSVVGVQVVGGLLSGSLALLADAGHMLTDAVGVGVALLAATIAARPATDARTYGLQRAEILAALANALVLTAVAVWVLVEAARRWSDPPDVETGLMISVAAVGAAANAVSLLLLRRGRRESLNVRGAYLEVLGDLLGSLAAWSTSTTSTPGRSPAGSPSSPRTSSSTPTTWSRGARGRCSTASPTASPGTSTSSTAPSSSSPWATRRTS